MTRDELEAVAGSALGECATQLYHAALDVLRYGREGAPRGAKEREAQMRHAAIVASELLRRRAALLDSPFTGGRP